jgi:hypothetical protein
VGVFDGLEIPPLLTSFYLIRRIEPRFSEFFALRQLRC